MEIVPTYVCNRCDILLMDGVRYTWCPKCGGEVATVDPTKEIYVCPKCEYMPATSAEFKDAEIVEIQKVEPERKEDLVAHYVKTAII
jgi:Zn finger protein HypA/HybF involved in hydrogenase expression